MTSLVAPASTIDRATEILIAHRTGFMPKGSDWHSNSEKGIMCFGCDRTWLFADDRNAGDTAHRHVAELLLEEGLLTTGVDTGKAEFYKNAAIAQNGYIHDVLAKALGYRLYVEGEPGYSADRENYVTGDHTADSLALDAAAKLSQLEALSRESALISAKIAASEYFDGAVILDESDFEVLEKSLKIAIDANSTAMDASQCAEAAVHVVVAEGKIKLELAHIPQAQDVSMITVLVGVEGTDPKSLPIDEIRREYAKIIQRDHPAVARRHHRYIFIAKADK